MNLRRRNTPTYWDCTVYFDDGEKASFRVKETTEYQVVHAIQSKVARMDDYSPNDIEDAKYHKSRNQFGR